MQSCMNWCKYACYAWMYAWMSCICIVYDDKTDGTNKTRGKPTSQYVQILGKSWPYVDIVGDRVKAIDGAKSGYKV
jgi:hypothetical protein